MKIALINGSPKAKESASEYILKTLKTLINDEHEIAEYHYRIARIENADLEQIAECDILVFAFPLYVDGIPSHLLNCLYEMETFFKTKPIKKIAVYSIVNGGFYEGHQNAIALEIMKNWCEKAKLNWGQGIGIGGGGMLPMLIGIPDGKGPKKNLSIALNSIAKSISIGALADNIYISPNFPRFAYKLLAEMGWRQRSKANGLKRKDLLVRGRIQR
jgi:multimeric flavodoxin WrbA